MLTGSPARLGISECSALRDQPSSGRAADDPEQSKRFLEATKSAEADETPEGAEKAFKAVVKPRKGKD
jgi:hypothetical protein